MIVSYWQERMTINWQYTIQHLRIATLKLSLPWVSLMSIIPETNQLTVQQPCLWIKRIGLPIQPGIRHYHHELSTKLPKARNEIVVTYTVQSNGKSPYVAVVVAIMIEVDSVAVRLLARLEESETCWK